VHSMSHIGCAIMAFPPNLADKPHTGFRGSAQRGPLSDAACNATHVPHATNAMMTAPMLTVGARLPVVLASHAFIAAVLLLPCDA